MTFYVDGTTGLTFNDSSTQSVSALTAGKLATAKMPAGSVIQVVNATNGTEQYTTSGSEVDTSTGSAGRIPSASPDFPPVPVRFGKRFPPPVCRDPPESSESAATSR